MTLSLKVHHLNCGTLHPRGGRLITGHAAGARAATLVCHCLLLETPSQGLVLVHTGFGTSDLADPEQRLGSGFLRTVRPVLLSEETAQHQVVALGRRPAEVRHIVLTHLDRDHVGGLADFPAAQVHVHQPALEAALFPVTPRDRARHRAAQWAHQPLWQPHSTVDGPAWFGLPAAPVLPDLPDLLLVSLPGHSTGHAGVAVRLQDHPAERWLLHAGDAYFCHREVATHSACPPGLRLFQRRAQASQRLRLQTQRTLRDLAATKSVTVISAHDPDELNHRWA